MEKSKILVGTSGWSYEDWVDVFYPPDISKSEFLEFYCKFFKTVEVNFTYYQIPTKYVISRISKVTPVDFEFVFKLNNVFTHQKGFQDPYTHIPTNEAEDFANAIMEAFEDGKVSLLLAQFPEYFTFSEKHLDYILMLKKYFYEYVLAVEFRHKSWVNDISFKVFEENKMVFVSVDEPNLANLMPRELFRTSGVVYIRFHSRDGNKWYKGEKLRYDYYYSQDELYEWAEKIKSLQGFEKAYIYFNNCHMGSAVKNALQMKELLNNLL